MSICAQVALLIMSALNIDLWANIPAEGVVIGLALAANAAPFSTMRLDVLAGQGVQLLSDMPDRRMLKSAAESNNQQKKKN